MRLVVLLGEDFSQSIGAIYSLRDEIEEILIVGDKDEEEQKRAARFRNGLHYFSKLFDLKWKIKNESIDDRDIKNIYEFFEKISGKNQKIALLVSNTNSTPTILLSSIFLKNQKTVFSYDAYDNIISEIKSGKVADKNGKNMDIATYCAMLGYEIVDFIDEREFKKDKDIVKKLFEDEFRFQKVRRALLNNNRDFPFENYKDILRLLEKMGIVKGSQIKDEYCKNRLQGRLFEEYIYWQCKDEGFDDIKLGCKIDFFPNSENGVINEFDVLAIKDNRIKTVECKYVHYLDTLSFVYKYDAVVDYFGRASKALIVNIFQKRGSSNFKNYVNDSTLMRAKLGNVRVYADKKFDQFKLKNHLKWLKN